MSKIKPTFWQYTFGSIPMPMGCTYEQFVAAREVFWKDNDSDFEIKAINIYREITEKFPNNAQVVASCEQLTQQALERIEND